LIHLKNLLMSRPYFERIPDQSLLLSPKVGDEHIRCTRGDRYLFCYLPSGGEVELNPVRIPWTRSNAWWFDPGSGETLFIGTFKNSDRSMYQSPSRGYGVDWVLVLDDASLVFSLPGMKE